MCKVIISNTLEQIESLKNSILVQTADLLKKDDQDRDRKTVCVKRNVPNAKNLKKGIMKSTSKKRKSIE